MQDEGIRFAVGLKLKKGKFYARIRTYVPGAPRKETDRLIGPAWDSKRGRVPRGHFTKAMAEDRVAEIERELYAVEDAPAEQVVAGLSLGELGERFLHHREYVKGISPSTMQDYIGVARMLEAHFGKGTEAESISVKKIERYRDGLIAAGRQPRTANKHLTLLSAMFNYGMRKEGVKVNPAAEVDKLAEQRKKEVIVFAPEKVRLIASKAKDETHAALYLTAAFAGLRQGELRALPWKNVRFQDRKIVVDRAFSAEVERGPKGSRGGETKTRYVPMSEEVWEALFRLRQRDHHAGDEDLVFCEFDGERLGMTNTHRRFQAALKRAKLPAVKFHGLRHTFGSTLAARGFEMTTIQQLMGHADLRTTELYRQWMPMEDEAERLSNAFSAPTQGYSGGTGAPALEVVK